MKSASMPDKIKQGGSFTIQIKLINKGFASPFNPRPVQLILRNKETGKLSTFTFNTSIQKWYTGDVQLKQTFMMPLSAPAGQYEVLLNLPDGYASLKNDPAYSIRLANENVWEPSTGFNKLGQIAIN